MKRLFVFLTLLLVSVPAAALAEVLGDVTIGTTQYNIFKLIFSPSIPDDVLIPEKLLQYLLFPLVAVIMIMYGILTEIRIFRKSSINGTLAILIAIISSASGTLWVVVQTFFGAGGWFGVIAFGFLLIAGIFLWAGARLWGWGVFSGGGWRGVFKRSHEVLHYEEQLARLRGLYSDLRGIGDPESLKQADEMLKRMEKIEKALLEKRKRNAEETAKDAPSAPA